MHDDNFLATNLTTNDIRLIFNENNYNNFKSSGLVVNNLRAVDEEVANNQLYGLFRKQCSN